MPSAKRKKKINKQGEYINLFCIASVILIILLTIINLQKKPTIKTVLGTTTEIDIQEITEEKKYWEEFLSLNPTYYDGWKRLSTLEIILGETKSSKSSLEVAKRIDPSR